MANPIRLQVRTLPQPRDGRPARRATAARASARPINGRRSLGWLRAIRNAIGEIFGMAVILALSIVLAHALLVLAFPV